MSETRFEPRTSNLPCVGEGANYCTTGEAEKVNESTQLNKCVSTPEMLAIPVILALKSGIVLFVIPKIPYDNCSLTRDQSAVTAPFVTSAAQTLCSGNSEMSARSPLSLSATTTELFREYSSNSIPDRPAAY